MDDDSPSLQRARTAKSRALETFSRFGDVVGVGLTKTGDAYGLKVNFRVPPHDPDAVPGEVDGVPVKWEVVGQIRKRETP